MIWIIIWIKQFNPILKGTTSLYADQTSVRKSKRWQSFLCELSLWLTSKVQSHLPLFGKFSQEKSSHHIGINVTGNFELELKISLCTICNRFKLFTSICHADQQKTACFFVLFLKWLLLKKSHIATILTVDVFGSKI